MIDIGSRVVDDATMWASLVVTHRGTKTYNPDQPRDDRGRFGTNGNAASKVTAQSLAEIQHRLNEESQQSTLLYRPGDSVLKSILIAKGFDAKPQLVESEDDLQGTKIYRGLAPYTRGGPLRSREDILRSATDLANDFKTGELFAGSGMYGNGSYFAEEKTDAEGYANSTLPIKGEVITGALAPDANVLTVGDHWKDIEPIYNELVANIPEDFSKVIDINNLGHVAALNNYDAIHVTGDPRGEMYVVLNRGKMQVVA